MTAELTPWFPQHIKPKRRGVYMTRFVKAKTGWSYWDGKGWSHEWETPEQANAKRYHGVQSKDWRGLSTNPSTGE